jgi:hypothetical protein
MLPDNGTRAAFGRGGLAKEQGGFILGAVEGRSMRCAGLERLRTRRCNSKRQSSQAKRRSIMATSVKTMRAYQEVIEFIAAGTSPSSVIAFQPSEAAKQRVADLIYREKTTGLSPDEKSELDHYMQLEHLMRLAKARAPTSHP